MAGLRRLLLASAPAATGIKAGLLHWWDLEEASGVRADAHGSKPLTPVGTVGSVAARVGNGSSASPGGYLQSTGSESLATGDFTLCGVFSTTAAQYGVISRNGNGASVARQWLLGVDNPSATLFFGVSTSGTANTSLVTGPTGMAGGVLHDYFAWRDTTAGTINLQVDGGTIYSAACAATDVLYSAVDPGFTLHGIGSGTYLNGGVADGTGIWARMLSAAERASIRNGGAWRNYAGLAGL